VPFCYGWIKMNYWLTTDTHFGHDALIEHCGRPENFTEKIFKSHSRIDPQDMLIHLGDICIGDEKEWHKRIWQEIRCKKCLVKGNHDKRTNTWYLRYGWDFVADAIMINIHGAKLLFSHIPQHESKLYDMNIHGHFHNIDHRKHEQNLKSIKHPQQILIKLEHDYMPIKITPKQVGKWWAEYYKQQAAYEINLKKEK